MILLATIIIMTIDDNDQYDDYMIMLTSTHPQFYNHQ